MKIRLISGTCYVLLLAAFFCLKVFVHDFLFDALIYAFAIIGTVEMLRAMKEKTTKAQRGIVFAYALIAVPIVAVLEYYRSIGVTMLCWLTVLLAVALLSLLVFDHEQTSLENLGCALLSAIYPTVFLCILVLCNHSAGSIELAKYEMDSKLMILFIFVISPCADSIAYVFGKYMRGKFPKKLAPSISPNKTVVGGIGGLVGGMLGAAILYFIYNGTVGTFDHIVFWLPMYMLVGLVLSVVTAFGDLVESCIKRKVGLKDMGKIMPGHGGVLDRLDGTFFATFIVYVIFTAIHILA